MKKFLLLLAFMVSLSSYSAVNFSHCMSYNGKPTGSYVSCINRNFSKASFELEGLVMRSCFAYVGSSTIGFTSCINSNFQRVLSKTDGSIYFSYCNNFGDDLSVSFMSCAVRNFNRLASYLNNQDVDEDYSERID